MNLKAKSYAVLNAISAATYWLSRRLRLSYIKNEERDAETSKETLTSLKNNNSRCKILIDYLNEIERTDIT